jgi:hypothetical protein
LTSISKGYLFIAILGCSILAAVGKKTKIAWCLKNYIPDSAENLRSYDCNPRILTKLDFNIIRK